MLGVERLLDIHADRAHLAIDAVTQALRTR